MINLRTYGLNHIYFDENIEDFSNVAVGLIIRALGHGLKIAYIDCSNTASKFTNFLENLSLSNSFIRKFDRFLIDIYRFKSDLIMSKTILPLVEFTNIPHHMFWKEINSYDLVVFDKCYFKCIPKLKIINLLNNKPKKTEIIFVLQEKKEFDEIKSYFDLITHYKHTNKNTIISKSNILNITGNGKGKSTYCFGMIIRAYLNKDDVRLIYFDKGGDFYGERRFFDPLKKWAKENTLYGRFDYVATGCRRFDGSSFRFENSEEDKKEAKEGLMLLRTALKKQTPVIAEELNTTIKTNLLDKKEVLDVLKSVVNELIITGRYSPKEFLELSNQIIEAEEIKHYSKFGHSVRKGIDF